LRSSGTKAVGQANGAQKGTRQLTWRLAGLWAVVLALGLAAVGMIYALQQVRVLTAGLEAQAEAQATFVAERVRGQFEQQLVGAFRGAVRCSAAGASASCDASRTAPTWVNGVFAWKGQDLQILLPPRSSPEDLEETVRARLAVRPLTLTGGQRAMQRPELVYDLAGDSPFVLALLHTNDLSGEPFILASHIRLAPLQSDLIEPLLSPDMGLELAFTEGASARRAQPLFGVMRYWGIQPTQASVREQRNIILGQTSVYLGLTALALGTLLAAIWVLVRVVRREVALAEMKANFVADVSHELKTPLALIRMFGETLQSGRVQDEEKRQEYYGIITRESTRLTNLINNILDFAKINAGYKTYSLQPTDVASVVRQTFEAYCPQLEHNGFEHSLTVADSLPEADADPDAIAQALINLIQNAIKYSAEERSVAVDVAEDVRRDRRGVLISVHDRGIGIRPEDRRHVFAGFFRAQDGRVAKQGGAGLGLALVKHIVDAHGGTLDVESRLVKGSTFRIFLPASESRAVQKNEISVEGSEAS